MKKIMVVAIILCGIASYAMADAYVNWYTPAGFFQHDAGSVGPDTGGGYAAGDVGIGNSVLWALIYTTAGSVASVTATDIGGGVSRVDLSEGTIVDSRWFATGWTSQSQDQDGFDAGLYAIGSPDTSWQDLSYDSGGNIYQAVFTSVSWNGSQITFSGLGIWYLLDTASFVALDNKNMAAIPAPLPQQMMGGGVNDQYGVRVDTWLPAVPEPATMSLLGLGALVMAIRRRRS